MDPTTYEALLTVLADCLLRAAPNEAINLSRELAGMSPSSPTIDRIVGILRGGTAYIGDHDDTQILKLAT